MTNLFAKLDDDFEVHNGILEGYEYCRMLYQFEVLRDRPVAYWRLDETDGTVASDLTSNSTDGTYTGTFALGQRGILWEGGTSVLLDGGSVVVPYAPHLRLDISWTIEFIFKLRNPAAASTQPGLIWRGDPTEAQGGYAIYYEDDNKLTLFRNNTAYTTLQEIAQPGWAHAAVSYDSITQKLTWYTNGTANVILEGVDLPASIATDDFYIGRYFSDYTDAWVSNVAIYHTALSAERIDYHYKAMNGAITAPPIFNELESKPHYDLRAYHSMDLVVPRTMNDMQLYNVDYWRGATMLDLKNQRVVEGRTYRPASMDDIEAIDGEVIEGMLLQDVERWSVSLGNEEWPLDDNVIVGKVADYRYANALQIQLQTGRVFPVSSYYLEDINTDFNDPNKNYKIELVFRDLPSQSEYAHLDLDESFIDFSSGELFEEEVTDSIPLALTEHSLDGGNTYASFPKSLLAKATLQELRRIKFRFQAAAIEPPPAPEAEIGDPGDIDGPQQYQITWVTTYGESIPGDFSDVVTASNDKILVTLPLGPEGVIGRNLYRRGGADDLGEMVYLDTLDQTTLNLRTMDQVEHFFAEGVALITEIADNTTIEYEDNHVYTGAEDEPPDEDTSANFVVKLQGMRLFEEGFGFNELDIDTKRYTYGRAIPRSGMPEWITDFPPIWMNETRPKNLIQYLKFNSGHHAPAGKENSLSYIFRYDPNTGQHIQVKLDMNPGDTKLSIYKFGIFVESASGPLLMEETDYFLKVEAFEDQITASLFEARGVFLGTLIVTTDAVEVNYVKRGFTGLWMQPYNYDFVLDYTRNYRAEFAHFESQEFLSVTPVIGATIYPHTSLPVNMIDDVEWVVSGEDATVEEPATVGNPPPAKVITRTGSAWYGGLESLNRIITGDPKEVLIVGDIYPVTQTQGRFRVMLIDKNDCVGFFSYLPQPIANKWNHFEIPIRADLVPAGYRFFIHQIGFKNNVFRVDNVQLSHQTISWEAKTTGAWQRFSHAIGDPYTAVHFAVRDTEIKVRATALSDDCWIQGYELVPIYSYPGQLASVK